MAKQVISPEEFIAEINKRLPGYRPTRLACASLVPPGATGASAAGYDWEPKDLFTVGVIATVAWHLESEFAVSPHISRVLHN